MSEANTAFLRSMVLGGAFFGDNLSFISDTTIAATRSQDAIWPTVQGQPMDSPTGRTFTLIAYIIMDRHAADTARTGTTTCLSYPTSSSWRPHRSINVTIVLSLGILTAIIMMMVWSRDSLLLTWPHLPELASTGWAISSSSHSSPPEC
ncbi:hypothetical protein [Duncaniella dubosii]|uniref:hypothetical protein n=1 Tax=Duncaniella dubosii TaxID=2518971 RepID=UPI003F681AB3